jgi:hypothetical protein
LSRQIEELRRFQVASADLEIAFLRPLTAGLFSIRQL